MDRRRPSEACEAVALIGGGEHAMVVADVAQRLGIRITGCWAPDCKTGLVRLGDDGDLEAAIDAGRMTSPLHVALGAKPGGGIRKKVVERLEAMAPLPWLSLFHPSAVVAASANISPGCFLAAGALVNPGAVVGRHVIVNTGAIVEHDVVVGEGAHLCPGCVTGGGARIGAWAFIGLGAIVRDHVSIGVGAVVGMGAVVVRDVPDGAWVTGNPAQRFER